MTDALQILINISGAIPLAMNLVMLFATIVGVVMVGTGLMQMYAMSAMDNRMGAKVDPKAESIASKLIIGSILISSIYFLQISGQTIFGTAVNGGAFLYQSGGMSANQQAALEAVFSFFMLVGYIAFIRGWFILDQYMNNIISTGVGKAAVHIIFGVLLVYLDQLLQVVADWTGFDFIQTFIF